MSKVKGQQEKKGDLKWSQPKPPKFPELKLLKPLSLVTANMFQFSKFDQNHFYDIVKTLDSDKINIYVCDYQMFTLTQDGFLVPLEVNEFYPLTINVYHITDEIEQHANQFLIEWRLYQGA